MNSAVAKKIKQSDYIITPGKVLNDSETASLRALCSRYLNIPRERRNSVMILLALECGLRASEVLGIQVGDVDFESKTIFIRSLKGSMPRILPVRKSLADALKNLVLDAHHDVSMVNMIPKATLIFDITYARLEQVWRMMRPNPQKTFHSLRHTFAVVTYLRTRDIKLVQSALGHKNIDNTMVYVDYVYTNTSMRKALVIGE